MWRVWLCVAGLGAAGCVSSGTWSSFHAVERALEREEERSEASRELEAGAGCDALASRITEGFPSLRATRRRARAALARGRGAGSLPAPEAMVEVWDFPVGDPQLAGEEGMYMVGLAQRLPPAGALDARARAAAGDAEAAMGELANQRRQLRARALDACFAWSVSELEADRLRRAEAVATTMRESLVAQVRAGGPTPIGEIARVDAELARLARVRVEAEGRSARASAKLSAWMGDAEVPSAPPALEVPRHAEIDRLVAIALERHGALRAARARVRAAEARADAADAEATVPTFTLRATYMQMPSARPGVGAAIGMTLPWLWSGEGAARDAARLEAEAQLDEVHALELEVRAEVRAAAAELEAATRALEALRERERPAAERALEAIAARYPSGAVDLDAWLDAARALRELEVEEARLLGRAARAWAALEGAVGDALASASGEGVDR